NKELRSLYKNGNLIKLYYVRLYKKTGHWSLKMMHHHSLTFKLGLSNLSLIFRHNSISSDFKLP
ncbi:MAG: hypothetical protein WBB28_18870, partial [Crinalium sp.]